MTQSLYDAAAVFEQQRMSSDILYRSFMNRDTSEMDAILTEIVDMVKTTNPTLSKRFHEVTDRTVNDNVRIAKHALLLFGLYLTPDYAKRLLQPKPKVNPEKFKRFYAKELPLLCTRLLDGTYTSMQEFVENARMVYVVT